MQFKKLFESIDDTLVKIDGVSEERKTVEDNLKEKERLQTPRGSFCIFNGTLKDFKKMNDADDWGLGFSYCTEDGTCYDIMHNYKKQHGVALLRTEEDFEDLTEGNEDVNNTFITKIKEVITKNQNKYPEVALLKVEKTNDNDTYHFEFKATKDFLSKEDKVDNYQKLTDFVLNTGLTNLGAVNKPLIDDFDVKEQDDGFVVSADIKIRDKELDEDINENEENLDIIPDVGTLIIRNRTIGEIIKFPNFKYTDKRDLVKQIDYFADHLGDNLEVTLELAKPRDEEYYVDNIDGFDTRTIVGIHIAPGEEEKIYTFEG